MTLQQKVGQRLSVLVCIVIFVAIAGVVGGSFPVSSSTQHSGSDLSVQMSGGSISPGETVEVEVTLENTGTDSSPAPVFNLTSLPEGWGVISWTAPDSTYRESSNEWLWTELKEGNTHSLIIDIRTPDDASDTTITGIVTDGASNANSGSADISLSTTNSGGGGRSGGGGSTEPSQSETTSTPTATVPNTETPTRTTSSTTVPKSSPAPTQSSPTSTTTETTNNTTSPSRVSPSETSESTQSGVQIWVILASILLLAVSVVAVLLLR